MGVLQSYLSQQASLDQKLAILELNNKIPEIFHYRHFNELKRFRNKQGVMKVKSIDDNNYAMQLFN